MSVDLKEDVEGRVEKENNNYVNMVSVQEEMEGKKREKGRKTGEGGGSEKCIPLSLHFF